MEMNCNKYEKGSIGERYVAHEISKFGYKILYVGGCQLYSITGEKFYNVDLEPFGFGKTFWVQVKHKNPRKYYPDTGMELWRYKNLIKHQNESGLKVLVLFIDDSKKIYGEWLDNLPYCVSKLGCQTNTKNGVEMIYWLVEKLKSLNELINKI